MRFAAHASGVKGRRSDLARVLLVHRSMARLTPDQTAARFLPRRPTLAKLEQISRGCTACHLYKRGTQTVFGAGAKKARILIVGEQPGNEEDLSGAPFVGPAGKMLDRALVEAGIDRNGAWVTNVVKHFKWEPRGRKRIHKKPNAIEIEACMPWLEAEIGLVGPELVVCLGATAAQALLGRKFKVTEQRGIAIEGTRWAPIVVATVHPSSLLRAPDDETRRREIARFIDDLRKVRELMQTKPGTKPID